MGKLTFVFVHGLAGWGSYDKKSEKQPYWGMHNGDVLAYLRQEGYDCYAASVAPTGSAWDRACELYAQIAGARVDYGEAHSRRYGHDRYGRDFSTCPLIPEWNDDTRLVLIGHSFGGATIRQFAELLANGNTAEREATQDSFLSPLFAGSLGNRVHSIVTLAAPMNGTSAYDLNFDPDFDPNAVKVPWWSNILAKMMASATKPQRDSRDPADYADFDMFIYNAIRVYAGIETLPHVYYF